MMIRPSLLAALLSVVLFPLSASACGGFFCNAADPTVVVQAGERVIFSNNDGLTTMHIEVAFQGEPTEFGWIVPLPDVPRDAAGEQLPLDQAVELSHSAVFDRLQSATNPSYSVNASGDPFGCDGTTATDSTDGTDGTDGTDASNGPPPVVVLEQANVGPYVAQLIKASEPDALFGWLEANGYTQDLAAKPLLADYVKMDYVFVGLRLRSGKSTGDLRPVAVRIGETAACVPLRLTSIAATANMPVLVWVLGEARAVPKNFMHAVINPQALSWPGAPEYQAVLDAAVDSAVGHAFVTEYAQPGQAFAEIFLTGIQRAAQQLAEADTNVTVLEAYIELGLPLDDTFTSVVMEATGWDGDGNSADLQEFLETSPGSALEFKQALQTQIIEPLGRVQDLFDRAQVVTRLYTTVDPEDMTRDPVFVFNKELPLVSPNNQVNAEWSAKDCATSEVVATWPDGARFTWDCESMSCPSFGSIPARSTEPLLRLEVIDETGQPTVIQVADAAVVDSVLEAAKPGSPSLPNGYTPSEGTGGTDGGSGLGGTSAGTGQSTGSTSAGSTTGGSGGCSAGGENSGGIPVALLLMVLMTAVWRQRFARA